MESPSSYKISRTILPLIQESLFQGKVVIIYGPRRIGKTTLVKKILSDHPHSTYLNCDEPSIRLSLSDKNSSELKQILGPNKLIVIDEAQRVKNIGITLKLLVDTYPDMQIVATGSSSFELANQISEPLTGRAYQYMLYPLSLEELRTSNSPPLQSLENYLIFGTYPEITTETNQQFTIRSIANNYLYKDALAFQQLKNPSLLEKLLQSLALQIGNEVSLNELGTIVGIDKTTVERYLTILEHTFVIFRLRPLSHNPRKELSKKHKIYFWDLGIRNALINNFNPLSLRNDVGSLWENFSIAQSIIHDNNHQLNYNYYFWRTLQGQEIDLIKESQGKFQAYECKWSPRKIPKPPSNWKKFYPEASYTVLNPSNLLERLTTII